MPDRQNPDRSLRVWFRLIRLEARMQAAVGERLREIGVSIPQCDVLTTLTEQEGVSQQELAKRLYVTKGNISGLIDRLAEAGLVERRSTAVDRRQHAIHLTDAGRRMAEKAIAVQRRWIASTLGRMADADLEALETQLVALATSCASGRRPRHAGAEGLKQSVRRFTCPVLPSACTSSRRTPPRRGASPRGRCPIPSRPRTAQARSRSPLC